MKGIHYRIRQVISLTVAVVFSCTTVAWSAPAIDLTAVSSASISQDKIHLGTSVYEINIPESAGIIGERYASPDLSEPLTVLHIQDAHASLEAQLNIKSIIGHLADQNAVDSIFIEGAMDQIDADHLRFFSNSSMNERLALQLTREGMTGGAELFLLEHTEKKKPLGQPYGKPLIYGVEDPGVFRANLQAYRDVMAYSAETTAFLSSLRSAIATISPRVMNKRLGAFFKDWLSYEEERHELIRHLEILKQYAAEENGIDLDNPRSQIDWPQLARFFSLRRIEKNLNADKAAQERESLMNWLSRHGGQDRAARIRGMSEAQRTEPERNPRRFFEELLRDYAEQGLSFKNYPNYAMEAGLLVLQSELDASLLFEESEKLSAKITETLTKNANETKLLEIYRDYRLLKDLFSLTLTYDGYQQLLSRGAELSTIAARLENLGGAKRLEARPEAESAHAKALEFYRLAVERDEIIFRNFYDKAKRLDSRRAVLITGGFHGAGLRHLFQKNGISYVEITPKITELGHEEAYRDVMTLQGDVEVRRSYVNPPRAAELPALYTELPEYAEYYAKVLIVSAGSVIADAVESGSSLTETIQDFNLSSGAMTAGLLIDEETGLVESRYGLITGPEGTLPYATGTGLKWEAAAQGERSEMRSAAEIRRAGVSQTHELRVDYGPAAAAAESIEYRENLLGRLWALARGILNLGDSAARYLHARRITRPALEGVESRVMLSHAPYNPQAVIGAFVHTMGQQEERTPTLDIVSPGSQVTAHIALDGSEVAFSRSGIGVVRTVQIPGGIDVRAAKLSPRGHVLGILGANSERVLISAVTGRIVYHAPRILRGNAVPAPSYQGITQLPLYRVQPIGPTRVIPSADGGVVLASQRRAGGGILVFNGPQNFQGPLLLGIGETNASSVRVRIFSAHGQDRVLAVPVPQGPGPKIIAVPRAYTRNPILGIQVIGLARGPLHMRIAQAPAPRPENHPSITIEGLKENYNPGETVRLQVNSSDPDQGDTVSLKVDRLSYTTFIDGRPQIITVPSDQYTLEGGVFQWRIPEGLTAVRVDALFTASSTKPNGSYGGFATAAAVIDVTESQPVESHPSITITGLKDNYVPGETVELRLNAADPDEGDTVSLKTDRVTYIQFVNGLPVQKTVPSDQYTLEGGVFRWRIPEGFPAVRVDALFTASSTKPNGSFGGFATAAAVIDVTESQPVESHPSITITGLKDGYAPGQTVELRLNAADPDEGDTVTLKTDRVTYIEFVDGLPVQKTVPSNQYTLENGVFRWRIPEGFPAVRVDALFTASSTKQNGTYGGVSTQDVTINVNPLPQLPVPAGFTRAQGNPDFAYKITADPVLGLNEVITLIDLRNPEEEIDVPGGSRVDFAAGILSVSSDGQVLTISHHESGAPIGISRVRIYRIDDLRAGIRKPAHEVPGIRASAIEYAGNTVRITGTIQKDGALEETTILVDLRGILFPPSNEPARVKSNPNFHYRVTEDGRRFVVFNSADQQVAEFDRNDRLQGSGTLAVTEPDVSPDGLYAIIIQEERRFHTGHDERELFLNIEKLEGDGRAEDLRLDKKINEPVQQVSDVSFDPRNPHNITVSYTNGRESYYSLDARVVREVSLANVETDTNFERLMLETGLDLQYEDLGFKRDPVPNSRYIVVKLNDNEYAVGYAGSIVISGTPIPVQLPGGFVHYHTPISIVPGGEVYYAFPGGSVTVDTGHFDTLGFDALDRLLVDQDYGGTAQITREGTINRLQGRLASVLPVPGVHATVRSSIYGFEGVKAESRDYIVAAAEGEWLYVIPRNPALETSRLSVQALPQLGGETGERAGLLSARFLSPSIAELRLYDGRINYLVIKNEPVSENDRSVFAVVTRGVVTPDGTKLIYDSYSTNPRSNTPITIHELASGRETAAAYESGFTRENVMRPVASDDYAIFVSGTATLAVVSLADADVRVAFIPRPLQDNSGDHAPDRGHIAGDTATLTLRNGRIVTLDLITLQFTDVPLLPLPEGFTRAEGNPDFAYKISPDPVLGLNEVITLIDLRNPEEETDVPGGSRDRFAAGILSVSPDGEVLTISHHESASPIGISRVRIYRIDDLKAGIRAPAHEVTAIRASSIEYDANTVRIRGTVQRDGVLEETTVVVDLTDIVLPVPEGYTRTLSNPNFAFRKTPAPDTSTTLTLIDLRRPEREIFVSNTDIFRFAPGFVDVSPDGKILGVSYHQGGSDSPGISQIWFRRIDDLKAGITEPAYRAGGRAKSLVLGAERAVIAADILENNEVVERTITVPYADILSALAQQPTVGSRFVSPDGRYTAEIQGTDIAITYPGPERGIIRVPVAAGQASLLDVSITNEAVYLALNERGAVVVDILPFVSPKQRLRVTADDLPNGIRSPSTGLTVINIESGTSAGYVSNTQGEQEFVDFADAARRKFTPPAPAAFDAAHDAPYSEAWHDVNGPVEENAAGNLLLRFPQEDLAESASMSLYDHPSGRIPLNGYTEVKVTLRSNKAAVFNFVVLFQSPANSFPVPYITTINVVPGEQTFDISLPDYLAEASPDPITKLISRFNGIVISGSSRNPADLQVELVKVLFERNRSELRSGAEAEETSGVLDLYARAYGVRFSDITGVAADVAERMISDEHRKNILVFAALVNAVAPQIEERTGLDAVKFSAAVTRRLAELNALQAASKLVLNGAGLAVISAEGINPDLFLGAAPILAGLAATDAKGRYTQSVVISGEGANGIKNTLYGPSDLDPEVKAAIGRLIETTPLGMEDAVRQAIAENKDKGIAAALTSGEFSEMPEAVRRILSMILNPEETAVDFSSMDEEKAAEYAEAFAVRLVMLMDLASQLLVKGETIKDLNAYKVYVRQYFDSKGLVIDMDDATGSFSLGIKAVAVYLSKLKAAEAALSKSA